MKKENNWIKAEIRNSKISIIQWKWIHNIYKFIGNIESGANEKFHSTKYLH